MPTRKPDNDVIEQALAGLENKVFDQYDPHQDGSWQTAMAPRRDSDPGRELSERARHRLTVHQHIRDRIAEPPVTAQEIIGTLASHMRGDITQLLDESGQIDFKLIRERRLGHLLESVSITVSETEGKPAEVKTRVKLHSPRKAAVALARLAGIDPYSGDED
jgi:hypothetical protein